MKNKKLILMTPALLLLTVLIYELVSFSPDINNTNNSNSSEQNGHLLNNSRSLPFYRSESIIPGETTNIMEKIRVGKINLLFELARVKDELCTPQMKPLVCQDKVSAFIASLGEPVATQLDELFRKFIKYESNFKNQVNLKGLDLPERLKILKAYRREVFGDEDAKLVFGMEEAGFDYNLAAHKILNDSSNLPLAERLKNFETLRKNIFGPYYETITDQEDAGAKTQLEAMVRNQELDDLSDEDRQEAMHEIRSKYYSSSELEALEQKELKQRNRVATRNQKMDEFLSAETEFLKNNPGLSGAEKRKKLDQLRIEYLGDNPGVF